ncbi:Sulfotransferase 2A [Dorcoceras hygrometricum]|uniref:Sulfotransferase n=1 Tax=Dorcoceras hygrometricum TaxID=472368 RepID=A0A2Z7CK35_9LAMI|nr:Sulfotransferase 2A [Dorcoceras hygrometricum]
MAIADELAREKQSSAQESHEFQELLSLLPKEKGWRTPDLFLFQGFWCQPNEIKAIISIQKHYKADEGDIILATIPKSGTTWLKALCYAIVNRSSFRGQKNNPLLSSNPHQLVPFLEYKLFANDQMPNISSLPRPRILATHMPLSALMRGCVGDPPCKIVYVCRNPLDNFVSVWHYICRIRPESIGPLPLEDAFDMYCRGAVGFGPYWEHMLGYWRKSLERPDEVLFVRYEEMKEDIVSTVKRLAGFLGCPFSREEEENGEIGEIVDLCSFERMKELEVNRMGKGAIADFENKHLFRKAEVGDWVNHLTPCMVEKLTNLMEQKLAGSGLAFSFSGRGSC